MPATQPDLSIKLRKYPNRRYYDTTRSHHVTLEEIYQLIRDGYDVEITDSKSGEDITAKVLTQIILEQEAPKLDLFPIELLHQVIRASEPLVREFIDKYFSQAFLAFTRSREQADQYLRHTMGLQQLGPVEAWSRMMLGPFAGAFPAGPATGAATTGPADADQQTQQDLRQQLEQLRQQMTRLEEKLHQR